MDIILGIIDFALHINLYLPDLMNQYGQWLILILFLVIFMETGLIFTPFLPGDSLLFVAGSLCALGGMNIWVLTVVLFAAAFLGDSVNYWLAKTFGRKILDGPLNRFINQAAMEKARIFFDKNGAKTIILARFIPLIRTFIPFVAGLVGMNYSLFLFFNVTGAFVWVYGVTFVGYFFGNMPIVQNNFSLVIMGIIVLSFVPVFIEIAKAFLNKNKG